ncbi:hypothetical protein DW830_14950 [Prevotella sp. AM34-19LB]|nr:hypothetical protein DW830_14950 [Prevotella sp. AM34-19LB]
MILCFYYILIFSKTYPSFLTVKEGVFLPLRLSCKESSTFLTKPLFPQEREDVAGGAIALPEFLYRQRSLCPQGAADERLTQ